MNLLQTTLDYQSAVVNFEAVQQAPPAGAGETVGVRGAEIVALPTPHAARHLPRPVTTMRISRGRTIHEAIVDEVSSWPGVTIGRHRFGGTEFRYGRRELGHLHGNRLADLPFPLLVRDELVAAGRAEPHHIHPESGWVSYFIRDDTDVARVVALFRMNYDRPWTRAAAGAGGSR